MSQSQQFDNPYVFGLSSTTPSEHQSMTDYIDHLVQEPSNWTLMLRVCELVSTDLGDAREAEDSLIHHIEHGNSTAKLNTVGLLATMIQNTTFPFISYIASGRLLQALESTVNQEETRARVRARLLDAIALTSRIHGAIHPSFTALWQRVQPHELSAEEARYVTRRHAQYLARDEGLIVNLETLMAVYPPINISGMVYKEPTYTARGGIAEIFKGSWNMRPVAVKVLKLHRASRQDDMHNQDSANLRRVTREIRVWAALKHRNIIEFLGFTNSFSRYPAMISPWCDQGNALQYLERNPTISPKQRLRLSLDVSEGLQYLHQLKIVHGDLKPINVLIDDCGVAKLCDFGLVRLVNWHGAAGMTTTTPYTGTELYKAPELFMSRENRHPVATFESDIYSLGCVILEFVERVRPFQRFQTTHDRTDAIMDGDPPARSREIRGVLGELTAQFWDLLQDCWFRPDERPDIEIIVVSLQYFEENVEDPMAYARSPETSSSNESFGRSRGSEAFLGETYGVPVHDGVEHNYFFDTATYPEMTSRSSRPLRGILRNRHPNESRSNVYDPYNLEYHGQHMDHIHSYPPYGTPDPQWQEYPPRRSREGPRSRGRSTGPSIVSVESGDPYGYHRAGDERRGIRSRSSGQISNARRDRSVSPVIRVSGQDSSFTDFGQANYTPDSESDSDLSILHRRSQSIPRLGGVSPPTFRADDYWHRPQSRGHSDGTRSRGHSSGYSPASEGADRPYEPHPITDDGNIQQIGVGYVSTSRPSRSSSRLVNSREDNPLSSPSPPQLRTRRSGQSSNMNSAESQGSSSRLRHYNSRSPSSGEGWRSRGHSSSHISQGRTSRQSSEAESSRQSHGFSMGGVGGQRKKSGSGFFSKLLGMRSRSSTRD